MRVLLFLALLWSSVCSASQHYDGSQMPSVKVKHFLEQCSGIGVYDATSNSFAYGYCLGFTNGIVLGYQTAKVTDRKLWCIPPRTNNQALMARVITWIEANIEEYDLLMSRFMGSSAAAAVIVAALTKGYPCS